MAVIDTKIKITTKLLDGQPSAQRTETGFDVLVNVTENGDLVLMDKPIDCKKHRMLKAFAAGTWKQVEVKYLKDNI